ncbi:MAG: hypothetical protein ACRD2L_25590 [Terriglobia bacterium]
MILRKGSIVIRVYFVFEDPLDSAGVNLSYVDVPTQDPNKALERVDQAAESGELWMNMYPDDKKHPYMLIKGKMMYLDISALHDQASANTILPVFTR